ncbi:MAG: LysM peptidoglycan-binding domain-containing protein [Pirellulales bacterium]|nr:LysM peptidoglycan-binding domain-containing protein [Pirellulales bacterium]
MNAFKVLVTACVLLVIVYAAYVVINRGQDNGDGPPGVNFDWNAQLNITPGTSEPGALTFAGPAPDAPAAPPFSPASPAGLGDPAFAGVPVAGGLPEAGGPMPVVPTSASMGLAGPTAVTDSPRVLAPPPPSMTTPGLDAPAAAPQSIAGLDAPVGGPEDFNAFMRQADDALRQNRLADAHRMLSQRYQMPGQSPTQIRQLEGLLDQLAGTVIYSREHMVEPPHLVAPTDTLQSVADRYNVPAGLLAKINGLDPAAPLRPGQELKVIRGPFAAIVDLNRCALTLFTVDGRYAGRFAIGAGPESAGQDGTFMVTDKTDISALGPGVSPVYGTRWIGLGERLGLHGTNAPQDVGRTMNQGCIALGQRDIEDLYDILSIGSRVVIRR